MTSSAVRQLLTIDMGHRYTAPDRFYKGTRFLDELEQLGEQIAREVFHSDWASLRPLSGHNADMIAVSTMTRPGDSILTVGPDNGGYPGISDQGYAPMVGVHNLYFPFNTEEWNIKVEEARLLIKDRKPALVVFGQSFFLFPHPVSKLVETCREIEAKVAYDASHVMGLVAGGAFQDPFKEGVDLIMGSTHKSLFGPQGGIILGSSAVESQVKARQFPGLVDNAHWNRMAALAWALDESRRQGAKYAKQVIANAKTLAKALHENNLPVKCVGGGFTESHQVLLGITGDAEIERFTTALEGSNIIVDRGVRLGTNEMTRRGMKSKEMERIAELIARVYHQEPTARVKREATRLRQEFQRLEYT